MPTKTKKNPRDQRPTCSVCGGYAVEDTAWITYRPDGTAEVVNGEGPFGDCSGCWCHDCDEHTELVFKTTTPADDARRQKAAAAREAGPELLAALAALVRVAGNFPDSPSTARVYREALKLVERLA